MENHNATLVVGLFCLAMYIVFTFLVFSGLADVNKLVKKSIFQMYHVPLENK